jgi:Lrp/AsnC family leucine-responsive transcriptional regulator
MRTNTPCANGSWTSIDRNILRILQQPTGRISFTELGEARRTVDHALHRARAPPGARTGSSMGYNARLNPHAFQGRVCWYFVEISLDYKSGDIFEEFRRAVLKLPHVLECHLMFPGTSTTCSKRGSPRWPRTANCSASILLKLPHVRESKSYIVMEEVKESLNLPIPD